MRIIMVINIRNVKVKYSLLQIQFWKSLSQFMPLLFFHHHNYIGPRKFFLTYGFAAKQSGRFSLEFSPKNFLGSFASVLVLITNEKHFHVHNMMGVFKKCSHWN